MRLIAHRSCHPQLKSDVENARRGSLWGRRLVASHWPSHADANLARADVLFLAGR
jgi:hypothetical protein